MERSWLLLPTGVSQLLTMLALVEQWGIVPAQAEMRPWMGGNTNARVKDMMRRMAALAGIRSGEDLDETFRFVLARRNLLSCSAGFKWMTQPGIYVSSLLRHQNPQWADCVGRPMMIPFKPYECFSLLLCAAGSPRLEFVADGPLIGADFWNKKSNWRWRGVHNYATRLPGPYRIHCPASLESDTRRFGTPEIVPEQRFKQVYARMAALPEVQRCARALDSGGMRCALVVSQPLWPEMCSLEEDTDYFFALMERLSAEGFQRIVFKPHPRDAADKLAMIAERCKHLGQRAEFLSETEAVVPIEVLAHYARTKGWICAGACSTAILSCRSGLGMQARCFTAGSLPFALQATIERFATQNEVQLDLLESHYNSR